MKKNKNKKFAVLYDGKCHPLIWAKIVGENENFFIINDEKSPSPFWVKRFCKLFATAKEAKRTCIGL